MVFPILGENVLSRDDVNAFLQALGGAHGIENLALDKTDSAIVEFGDDHALIFEFDAGNGLLKLWSPVCSLDVADTIDAETALLKFLLGENFPASRLGGAHLALEEDTGMALLARTLPLATLSAEKSAGLIDAFVQQVLDLTERIASTDWRNPLGEELNVPRDSGPGVRV